MQKIYRELFQNLNLPKDGSHKGQNGKLLIIGGSDLFHAASKWSLDVASRFVDMVFYASVPSNNDLIHQAKGNFWNGIVISRQEIPAYIEEADCILIGPGMSRDDSLLSSKKNLAKWPLTDHDWQTETKVIVDSLLARWPRKKWLIDAGALQMVAPELLNENCLITPHFKELQDLIGKISDFDDFGNQEFTPEFLQKLATRLGGATILLKGEVDIAANPRQSQTIKGGNPGMTKGGTGDVLAGLAAGLYATNDIWTAAVLASFTNKKSGENLAAQMGPFFNASDLAENVPYVFWDFLQKSA